MTLTVEHGTVLDTEQDPRAVYGVVKLGKVDTTDERVLEECIQQSLAALGHDLRKCVREHRARLLAEKG